MLVPPPFCRVILKETVGHEGNAIVLSVPSAMLLLTTQCTWWLMICTFDMIFSTCLWTLNSIDLLLGDVHLCVEVALQALQGDHHTALVAWSMTDNPVVFRTGNKVSGLRDQIKYTLWEFAAHPHGCEQKWVTPRLCRLKFKLCPQELVAVSSSSPVTENEKLQIYSFCVSFSSVQNVTKWIMDRKHHLFAIISLIVLAYSLYILLICSIPSGCCRRKAGKQDSFYQHC